MAVPASFAAAATTSATGVLLSITNSCDSSAFSLRNLARPPSTIFSTMFCGLPLSFAFSIAIERSRSTSAGSSSLAVERQRMGRGDVHRDLLAERAQRLGRRRALERDQHADLAEARRDLVVDVGHDRALVHLEHRGAAQRLVLADLGDVVGQLLLDRAAAGILRRAQRLDVGAVLERELGDVAHEVLEHLVLGDEVGLAS